MSLQSNIAVEIENELDLERWFEMGGPGSGNWGHRGRKGKRGGSMPGGGKAGKKLSAPVGDAGVEGNRGIQQLFIDAMYPGELAITMEPQVEDWENATSGERAHIKAQVAKDLSEKTGIPEEDCADFVKQWAHSSNDDDMRSLAIQKDAAEEFGVKTSKFTRDKIGKVEEKSEMTDFKQSLVKKYGDPEAPALSRSPESLKVYKEWSEKYPGKSYFDVAKEGYKGPDKSPLMDSTKQKALLRSMYDKTQADLKEQGIKEVRLSRGVKLDTSPGNVGDTVGLDTNSLESWTVSRSVSGSFASGFKEGQTGIVFEAVVPAERILSTPTTGFGCLTEGEVIVLGGVTGDTSEIVRRWP